MWCLGNEMDGPGRSGTRPPTSTAGSPPRPPGRCGMVDPTSSSWRAARRARRCRPSASGSATVLDRGLRAGRPHLGARLLRGGGRRPRLVPGLRRGHGPLHRRSWSPPRTHVACAAEQPTKRIHISFDEWNVWYQTGRVPAAAGHDWPVAPRAARGPLQRRGRRGGRQPADLPAAAHRPRALRVAGPAGQRDRADHDRAGRAGPGGRRSSTRSPRPPGYAAARCCRSRSTRPAVRDGQVRRRRTLDAVATHDPETGAVALFAVNRAPSETVALWTSACAPSPRSCRFWRPGRSADRQPVCGEPPRTTPRSSRPAPGHLRGRHPTERFRWRSRRCPGR